MLYLWKMWQQTNVSLKESETVSHAFFAQKILVSELRNENLLYLFNADDLRNLQG